MGATESPKRFARNEHFPAHEEYRAAVYSVFCLWTDSATGHKAGLNEASAYFRSAKDRMEIRVHRRRVSVHFV